MGGQVIEFEAKVIRDKALEEGLEQGREENHEQEMVSGIQRAMNKLNMTLDKAMEFMDIPEADQPRYALLLKESETNFDYNS